jgi:predicted Zn-dependent protease
MEILIGDAVADIGPKYSDIDEAIKRFNNRDPLSARALLEEARKKSPGLPPSDLTLAKMYFLAGNAQAGRAQLEKTVTENPGDPEAYLILADQDLSQGGTRKERRRSKRPKKRTKNCPAHGWPWQPCTTS